VRNLIIWSVVVAAVLGGTCGVLLHLLLWRGGGGRTALHTRVMQPVETDNSLGLLLFR
jgi:hypothetical protein